MKKVISIICLVAFICTVSFAAAWAVEKKVDVKPDAKKEAVVEPTAKEKAEIEKKVDLFYKVVAYGEEQKNPIILISAVKIFDDLGFSTIAKPGKDAKAVYERVALLDQAKLYAANDGELLAVIEKVQTPPEEVAVRSRHGGGGYRGHGGSGGYYGNNYGGHRGGGYYGGHYRGGGGWR
jgi:uncharacterized membrane protein YgcG